MNKDQIKALLQLPPDTKYFEQYKQAYTYVTGKTHQGTCGKCSIRQIIKLLRNYLNK